MGPGISAILDDVKRRRESTLVPRPRQALDGAQYRWYPTHGYQQDQPSVLLVPLLPCRVVATHGAGTNNGFDRTDRSRRASTACAIDKP